MSRGIILLLGIGLLLAGMAAGLLYPRLATRLEGDWVPRTVLTGEIDCNPVGHTCRAGDGSAGVALSVEAGAQPLRPFRVTVELSGQARPAQGVAVRFDMTDMEMGLNRFRLQPQGPGLWQGQVMIPVCSTGRADWLATVEVTGSINQAASFNVRLE